jgi:hypothetical protein
MAHCSEPENAQFLDGIHKFIKINRLSEANHLTAGTSTRRGSGVLAGRNSCIRHTPRRCSLPGSLAFTELPNSRQSAPYTLRAYQEQLVSRRESRHFVWSVIRSQSAVSVTVALALKSQTTIAQLSVLV